jgi:hypothetical protein
VFSGAWIVDPLNHYFGRRGEIFITACCLTATPIGSGFAKSWEGLFAARFIMGIGIGAKNATVPIYSAEMAPARIRGALVMFWQLWVVAGTIDQSHFIAQKLTIVCRNFPGILCERHCQRHRQHCLAPSTRFCVHPVIHPWCWHLLLPRVTALANETRQAREGFPVDAALTSSSHYWSEGLLLLVGYVPGGDQSGSRIGLLCSSVGLLRSPSNPPSKLWSFNGYVSATNVWYQQ